MLLTTLPKSLLPAVFSDHFLFHENLEQPYYCPEQISGLGMLLAGKGECDYFVNGERHLVRPGQVFLVNRASRLAIRATKKDSSPAMLFFHSRLPDLVRHSIEITDEKLLEENVTGQLYDFSYLERMYDNPAFFDALSSLIALGKSCSSFASLKADIMIRNLFEKLLHENSQAHILSRHIRAVKTSTRLEIYKRISIAKDWMEANGHRKITLLEMAAIANMNSQHFLRLFKQIFQITPHQYLVNLKLQKAKQLLRSRELTVSEVCHAIGFESVYSFSILFRKKFGISPGQFQLS